MSRNNAYKIDRRRRGGSGHLLIALLLLAAALLISFLIALIWQNKQENPENGISSISQAAPPLTPQAESSPPDVITTPASSEPAIPPPSPTVPAGALPSSERVNASYFDDAVFVGDSVTEGMLYCVGMENARVLAGTSINFSTIYTAEVIKLADGSRTTIMSELTKKPYKKVYVMLGGNEVRDQSKETFIERYGKVLDDIKSMQPDAIYYVQSMTPVTKINNYNMSNARIDEFNLAVMELAKEKGMYYLNIAESMKDPQGALPSEASPGDGMHFGQPYFDKWYAYLKTHVAPDSATPDQLAGAEKPSSESSSSVPEENTSGAA